MSPRLALLAFAAIGAAEVLLRALHAWEAAGRWLVGMDPGEDS